MFREAGGLGDEKGFCRVVSPESGVRDKVERGEQRRRVRNRDRGKQADVEKSVEHRILLFHLPEGNLLGNTDYDMVGSCSVDLVK